MIQTGNDKSNDLSQTLTIQKDRDRPQSSYKNSASENHPSDLEGEEGASIEKLATKAKSRISKQ